MYMVYFFVVEIDGDFIFDSECTCLCLIQLETCGLKEYFSCFSTVPPTIGILDSTVLANVRDIICSAHAFIYAYGQAHMCTYVCMNEAAAYK